MSPSRVPGSENLRFNRQVRGIGRIVNSAGTSSTVEYRYRDGILTKLIKNRSLDILREFKAERLSIGDLVTADREGRLFQLSVDMKLARPLELELEPWYEISADAKQSRRRYKTSWIRFLRIARECRQLKAKPSVADLGRINYAKMRRGWGASGSDWNRARAAVSAFLTYFLGSVHHPFRLNVMGMFTTREENEGPIPDITTQQFWKTVMKAPEYTRAAYAALAILGAGPKEYDGILPKHLNHEAFTVQIFGTKKGVQRKRREVAVDERLWHWVVAAVPAPLKYGWLRKYWIRACEAAETKGVTLYGLRHLSGQVAGDNGATDRDLQIHLGHSNARMSHRYSRRRVARKVAQAIGDALSPKAPAEGTGT